MAGDDTAPGVRIRPATLEDRFLIRRWLSDPEVQSWRGSAASAEAEITLAMDSPAALPRIVEANGVPVGYAQAVEMGLWAERPAEVPAGTWQVDYFVKSTASGDATVGEGVPALLAKEVFATTLAVACSAVVPIRNEAAARAYERAGFRWIRVLHDPLFGPSWLMLKQRPGMQGP